MFEPVDMLTLVDYKRTDAPLTRLTLENLDPTIELYYIRFNIIFPEHNFTNNGIYILPSNNTDDTDWTVRYANRDERGMRGCETGSTQISKPFLATGGQGGLATGGRGKPTACIGEAILVNEGISPYMYLKTHYTRIALDYSHISQTTVMSASNIRRNPYDRLHVIANDKTFIGEISIYKDRE